MSEMLNEFEYKNKHVIVQTNPTMNIATIKQRLAV